MSRKVAKIPVTWQMQGVIEIVYQLPEELSELIQLANMPKGKIVGGSYRLDSEIVEQLNINPTILSDIEQAIDALNDS